MKQIVCDQCWNLASPRPIRITAHVPYRTTSGSYDSGVNYAVEKRDFCSTKCARAWFLEKLDVER